MVPEQKASTQDYGIWPENVEAFDIFIRCMTQWRPGPNGVIGLDYNVVLALAQLKQVSSPLAMLEKLQIMELHARDLMNAKST